MTATSTTLVDIRTARHAPWARDQIEWVNSTKGVAIILVVLGHCWRGCSKAGLFDGMNPDLFAAIDSRIYAFHMPLFFILSGLFLVQSLGKSVPTRFLKSRMTRLIWPLLLWTYLFAAGKMLAGPLVNSPLTLDHVLRLPFPALWQFWFLWALFLLHMGVFLVRPLLLKPQTQQITLWSLLLASFALVHIGVPHQVLYWTNGALNYVPFLVVGMLLETNARRMPVSQRTALLAFSVFAVILLANPIENQPKLVTHGLAIVLCLSLMAGMSRASDFAPGLMHALSVIGTASMAIYLAHTFFSATIRIVLVELGITALGPHIVLGTILGCAMPLVMLSLTQHLGKDRFLGF